MLMTSQTTVQSQPFAANNPRLLIVDDERINLELFNRIFEYDYDLHLASTGEEALEALRLQAYDAVLLDIMLPGMNGFEVLRHIRADAATADLPVIMISARSNESDMLHGLRLGANDYIPKPFSVEIARARVRTQIELKQMNDRHKQLIDELRTAQRMQERFYRIVSHDLKGPLTNIRMAQSILRDILEDDPTINEILDSVDVTVQDMQEMIRLYLDAASLQAGKLQTHLVSLDVRDELHAAAERLAFVAEKKGVRIEIAPLDHPQIVIADARLLGQVLGNLISNALKFSPDGGVVRLWTEGDAASIVLCVSDQGPGIPDSERQYLFQMFRQLSTRAEGGSDNGHGLGLWIVRQLVEMMNGQVAHRHHPEGGSVFMVALPCAHSSPARR